MATSLEQILGQAYRTLVLQTEKALAVAPRVEDAVVPIYFPLKSSKPEQIASGVVVSLGGEYFVFSAAHVFDDSGTYRLLLGLGAGRKLIDLVGDRFSTRKGEAKSHRSDPIDASVFHIQSKVPDEMARIALSRSDLDFSQLNEERSVFFVAGFRAKESKTLGVQAYANRGCYPSLEYGPAEYQALSLDVSKHIAIAFEDQVFVGERWETSPFLRGVSGGAVVRIDGVSVTEPFTARLDAHQLLTAIAI